MKHIQKLHGTVVSNKMPKTVVVAVTRLAKHPKVKKYIRITKRYKAHHEGTPPEIGRRVTIVPSRPLSREKRWRVLGESV